MKETTENTNSRSNHRLLTFLVVFLVLVSQVFVVQKLQDKFGRAKRSTKHLDFNPLFVDQLDPVEKDLEDINNVSEMLEHLPPGDVDELEFEAEVVGPHKEMVNKFTKHPDLIIQKLNKAIQKEEKRAEAIKSEVNKVRQVLGLNDPPIPSVGRKLNSLTDTVEKDTRYYDAPPRCPARSPLLLGPLVVRHKLPDVELRPGTEAFLEHYGNLKEGGAYQPENCMARQKVAIIVPYRNREWHLGLFLYHMHPVLQRQQLDYQIFVVEQAGDDDFNRAALMNVGYKEASKIGAFTCFVFHDVDLVPEDDRNIYTCPKSSPKHLAVAVNKWKYRLIYDKYFGGVTALSKEQFEDINGFANSFYGWGGEDDDLHHRVEEKGYKVARYPGNIGRYSMLKHDKVKQNEEIEDMMEKSKQNLLIEDGLSTLTYTKLNMRKYPLYTWILANLPPPPPKKPKSFWHNAKSALWNGMSNVAGGFAKTIADKAQDVANANEEKEDDQVDHVY